VGVSHSLQYFVVLGLRPLQYSKFSKENPIERCINSLCLITFTCPGARNVDLGTKEFPLSRYSNIHEVGTSGYLNSEVVQSLQSVYVMYPTTHRPGYVNSSPLPSFCNIPNIKCMHNRNKMLVMAE
jgi:hypothetical protein